MVQFEVVLESLLVQLWMALKKRNPHQIIRNFLMKKSESKNSLPIGAGIGAGLGIVFGAMIDRYKNQKAK